MEAKHIFTGTAKQNTLLRSPWRIDLTMSVVLCLAGVAVVINNNFCAILWGLLFAASFYGLVSRSFKLIWYCMAMTPGTELLGRMSFAPAVPAEIGKYFLYYCIGLLTIARFYKQTPPPASAYAAGKWILLVIFPSLLYSALAREFDLKQWIFNLSCIIQIGILLLFTAEERWVEYDYYKLLKYCILPFLPVLVFLTAKTPKFDEINFENSANFSTTGKFGPNQVSTCIGLLLFLLTALLIMKKSAYKMVFVNIFLMAMAMFRGLITFSRGGMVVSVLAIISSYIVLVVKTGKNLKKYLSYSVIVIVLFVAFLSLVNTLTKDALLSRYTGKRKINSKVEEQADLNKLTANRLVIATTDVKMFLDYPLLGVGVGQSRYERRFYGGFEVPAHTEYTRLLSEHGFGGFFVIVILTIFPLYWVLKTRNAKIKSIILGLYILGVGNTFSYPNYSHHYLHRLCFNTCYLFN